MGTSIYSMPLALHFLTSMGLIGREASEMSVSPRQNFLKPPPEPDWPMVTLASVPF